MTNYHTVPFVKKTRIPAWEESPFVLNGDLYKAGFRRAWSLNTTTGQDIQILKYCPDKKVFYEVGNVVWGRYLGSAFVDTDGKLYFTGVTGTSANGNKIVLQEIDPTTWTITGTEKVISTAPSNLRYYNSSLCKGPDKYVCYIETTDGVPFSARFVQSTDLVNWSPIGAVGHPAFYSACHTIKYATNGYYIGTYLWKNGGTWESAIYRTNDFINLQTFQGNPANGLTPYHQIMSPDELEGNNNSDVDFTEWNGKVYFTYLTGDQTTWGWANDAWYDGSLLDFYREYWP